MPNRNLHEVMGHLGKDPELKITPTGKSVCRLSVATSNRIFDKETKKWIDKGADWHNVVVWGELAERVAQEFTKGDAIMVRGKHRTRGYESKGQKKQASEIVATEVYKPIYVKKITESSTYAQEEVPMQEFADEDLPDAEIPF